MKRLRKVSVYRANAVLLVMAPLLVGGCTPDVRVVDELGRPVINAGVTPIYPSFSGITSYTDVEGGANIGESWLLSELALAVHAAGFRSEWLPYPKEFPITVVLRAGHDAWELPTGGQLNGIEAHLKDSPMNPSPVPAPASKN